MKKSELYKCVLDYFASVMPPTETELHFNNPFELLVAVVLSAQCTDEAMAATTPEVIYDYIRSVSYPNNKARHLVGLARGLVERFGGQVPATMEELTSLPGVGRKTANVILAIVFGKAALAVDTHVFRVSHRLGLVPARCTTPLSVELELRRHIPETQVAAAHFWLLHHGRYTCTARTPHCEKCPLNTLCREWLKLHGVKTRRTQCSVNEN